LAARLIPDKNPLFIPFGVYDDCTKLLESNIYFPCLLSGPSGCGKTETIEHICAVKQRDYFRVNITFQTDEDDLIGGIRLEDGSTTYSKGPVIDAMETGGVLLLDELDLASPMLIMCLQSILEGKGYLIKKTKEWVRPKDGFQVFATANTKGIGDDTGSFVGTQILNEAFLERFPITFECDYPEEKIEKKILTTVLKSYNVKNDTLIKAAVSFANKVRASYKNGRIDHTISTRRLVQIMKAYSIWKNDMLAVEYCMSRFNTHTKNALMDIFKLEYESVKPKNVTSDVVDGDKELIQPWTPWL
jgi:MoxR-like ATPase